MPRIPNLKKEVEAHIRLKEMGSVMARDREPEWRRSRPLVGTLLDVLDSVLSFGPSPLDLGGGGRAEDLAGFFRNAGMKRQWGDYNPQEFVAIIQQHPRYARYKQLIENVVRKGLGDVFPAHRGLKGYDPLGKALVEGTELPPATAASLDSYVAEQMGSAGKYVEFKATPESVLALLPKRASSYAVEKEIILDPRWTQGMKVTRPGDWTRLQTDEHLTRVADSLLASMSTKPIPGARAADFTDSPQGVHKFYDSIMAQIHAALPEASPPAPVSYFPKHGKGMKLIETVTDRNYGGFPATMIGEYPARVSGGTTSWLHAIESSLLTPLKPLPKSAMKHAAAVHFNFPELEKKLDKLGYYKKY